MNTEQLNKDFEKLNLLKEKNSIERVKFCWQLLESDSDEYLDLHLFFLDKANKYFTKEFQEQFKFRKDKGKVFYFLQKKLNENLPDKLARIIPEIIEELDFKTLEEYQKWVEEIKAGKRDDENAFVWSIMKSPFLKFHYELMKDSTLSENFRRSLSIRYKEYTEEGEAFLLSKLDNNEDVYFHGEIIFILGSMKGKQKAKILNHARNLTKSENIYTRNMAIIVLGWIGQSKDLGTLKNHLLYDLDKECRASSAVAFYGIYDRIKNEKFKASSFEIFKTALENEKDCFVVSMIIYSMQQLTNKRFEISQKAMDEIDENKIHVAKEKIIRYLDKILANMV